MSRGKNRRFGTSCRLSRSRWSASCICARTRQNLPSPATLTGDKPSAQFITYCITTCYAWHSSCMKERHRPIRPTGAVRLIPNCRAFSDCSRPPDHSNRTGKSVRSTGTRCGRTHRRHARTRLAGLRANPAGARGQNAAPGIWADGAGAPPTWAIRRGLAHGGAWTGGRRGLYYAARCRR